MCIQSFQPQVATPRLILRAPVMAEASARAAVAFDIEHRQFGAIGRLDFHEAVPRRPELDVWLEGSFRGRGYGTEAMTAGLRWASQAWRRGAVWSGHAAHDHAAGQALCKAGFLYTGDVVRRADAAAPTRMMVWLA
ncbi:GNAT family N-acetyltransferase [Phenylobacterium sp.]|jgi:RimJ/RimL family protein N-acetyltransferase|uniref:GNAT family N-acetyltransferase n=1 Tax=Phenylobacterium sp. TaxID=1871053 RepID=UPI0037C82FDB